MFLSVLILAESVKNILSKVRLVDLTNYKRCANVADKFGVSIEHSISDIKMTL